MHSARTRCWSIVAAASVLLALIFASTNASAASKEECLDAHARGQDLREHGQLTRAKQAFLVCAQRTCPGLVQADCARFGDDLDRSMPTVSFVARDDRASDLPAASIYVDDALIASRLDDGRAYEIDPGRHTIRFVYDGREVTLTPVVNQGEKGRVLVATFPGPSTAAPATHDIGRRDFSMLTTSHRSVVPLVIAGIGAAAMVTGGALTFVGMSQMPSGCSSSSHDCAAPPGDPSLEEAHRAMTLTDIGLGTAITGGAVMLGGVVWYFVQPAHEQRVGRGSVVAPWVARGSGGVSLGGAF